MTADAVSNNDQCEEFFVWFRVNCATLRRIWIAFGNAKVSLASDSGAAPTRKWSELPACRELANFLLCQNNRGKTRSAFRIFALRINRARHPTHLEGPRNTFRKRPLKFAFHWIEFSQLSYVWTTCRHVMVNHLPLLKIMRCFREWRITILFWGYSNAFCGSSNGLHDRAVSPSPRCSPPSPRMRRCKWFTGTSTVVTFSGCFVT